MGGDRNPNFETFGLRTRQALAFLCEPFPQCVPFGNRERVRALTLETAQQVMDAVLGKSR